MTDEIKVPATETGDEGKDLSQSIKRTPEEIAAYNLKKKADEAKALGLDPKKVLGEESDTEVPAWYKAEKAKEIKDTALQMAETITDENTKKEVIETLNRLTPSGDPEKDFRFALGAVSAPKNKQILETINGYSRPKVVAAGGSNPPHLEEEFVPTAEESRMMKPPYNLSKEKVIAARKAHEAKQK